MKSKSFHNPLLIIGGIIVLILLFFIWNTIRTTSLIYLVPIAEGQTGSEVCFERDMSCISLSTVRVEDSDDAFYGFLTPTCDSQVIGYDRCVELFDTEFGIDNVVYVKSPNADSTQILNSDVFCLGEGKGYEGIYEFAHCVKG